MFSFGRPLALLLLLLVPLLLHMFIRSSRHIDNGRERFSLALRLVVFALLVLAIADPAWMRPLVEQNVVFLVDRSKSMEPEQEAFAEDFLVEALAGLTDDYRSSIIAFGREAVVEKGLSSDHNFSGWRAAVDDEYTNLEEAMRLGLAVLPREGTGRAVLLSDGQENLGEALAAALDYAAREVPLDVVSIPAVDVLDAAVHDVVVPKQVRPGEEFSVRVHLRSTGEAALELALWRAGSPIAEKSITVSPGDQVFTFTDTIAEQGFYRYRVEIAGDEIERTVNNWGGAHTFVLGEPQVLLVGERTRAAELFAGEMAEYDIQVEHVRPEAFPTSMQDLAPYSAVVLDDLPVRALARAQHQLLQSYVQDFGGGLLAAAGRESLSAGDYHGSALESMLPVHSRLEQRLLFPTLTMLIVLDKSGSMAERQTGSQITKMDLAKEATLAILELLVSEEKLGVIAFDIRAETVVPIQPAENQEAIREALAPVEPGGGTRIYPALERALAELQPDDSAIRHVVLLSDGISEPGDFQTLMQSFEQEGISVSTVSVGEDVDLELMEQLAEWGGGRHYHTISMDEIYQIFITETTRMTRSPVVEEPFQPRLVAETPAVAGIDWSQAPPLLGHTTVTPRDLADVSLVTPDNSPLLAGWRYGLGRTMAFTADLGQNWSSPWLEWEDYGLFFSQVLAWLMQREQSEELFVRTIQDGDQAKLVVDALDLDGQYLNFLQLESTVTSPRGSVLQVELEQTGPGEYAGQFPLGEPGTYMLNVREANAPDDGPLGIAVSGLTRSYSPEYRLALEPSGLLPFLAGFTGGDRLTSPTDLRAAPEVLARPVPLWSYLLAAVSILFVVDVGLRIISVQTLQGFGAGLRFLFGESKRQAGQRSADLEYYEEQMKKERDKLQS